MEHDTQKNDTGLSEEISLGDYRPAVTFESITFSDGTTIPLEPTDVVVLVGPNNAGKSAALRELEAMSKILLGALLRRTLSPVVSAPKKNYSNI